MNEPLGPRKVNFNAGSQRLAWLFRFLFEVGVRYFLRARCRSSLVGVAVDLLEPVTVLHCVPDVVQRGRLRYQLVRLENGRDVALAVAAALIDLKWG